MLLLLRNQIGLLPPPLLPLPLLLLPLVLKFPLASAWATAGRIWKRCPGTAAPGKVGEASHVAAPEYVPTKNAGRVRRGEGFFRFTAVTWHVLNRRWRPTQTLCLIHFVKQPSCGHSLITVMTGCRRRKRPCRLLKMPVRHHNRAINVRRLSPLWTNIPNGNSYSFWRCQRQQHSFSRRYASFVPTETVEALQKRYMSI